MKIIKKIKYLILVGLFITIESYYAVNVLADTFDSNLTKTGIRNIPKDTPTVLIDIPGVGYSGEAREGHWGHLLNPNTETIYVKHQGSKLYPDKWDTSSYDHVVSLSNSKPEELNNKLFPYIQSAQNNGKNIHIIIDKNITLPRHLLDGKVDESKWAANVADYVLETTPENYFKMQAMHSNGNDVPSYMKNTNKIDYAIISSPQEKRALQLVKSRPDMPIDVIGGVTDISSLGTPGTKGKLLRENPNLRIIVLQDKNVPWVTHSKVQNTITEGRWKILEGDKRSVSQGALGDILSPRINLYRSEKTDLSGVEIDPQPFKVGKGGSEIKKKVLDSRPSDDSLSWSIEIPDEVE